MLSKKTLKKTVDKSFRSYSFEKFEDGECRITGIESFGLGWKTIMSEEVTPANGNKLYATLLKQGYELQPEPPMTWN